MSEGTPGRVPDADTRSDEAQGSAESRPAAPPVRYGPRNGDLRNGSSRTGSGNGSSNGASTAANGGGNGATNGRNGFSGRTVPGPSSPQQYRAPQAPRGPQGGAEADDDKVATAAANGPASYSRPGPAATPDRRPNPPVEDRTVADARTATAARNASAAKVRGGSALTPSTRPSAAPGEARADESAVVPPADETAVIPAVVPAAVPSATPESSEPTTADTGKGFLGRLRDRLGAPGPDETAPATVADPAGATVDQTDAVKVDQSMDGNETGPESRTETTEPAAEDGVTEERPLTWRDRLGLAPKAPKPVDDSADESGVPTAVATTTAGTTPVETEAAPTGPTSAPIGLVTPASPVPPVSPDTVVIPAVEAGPAVPAAAGQASAAAKPRVGAARRTRKARLRLSRVDPWSVMKTALLFSIAAGIILVVATYGVWSVLNASGLFAAVNDMVKSVVSTPGDTTPFRIEEYVNTQKVIGVAAIIAVVDVLIFTALATLGSFLYNLAATVLGGLEVTLAED